MKILIVNKYLYPRGGSETYIMKYGAALVDAGSEVQYFGMDHPERCVGNAVGMYTQCIDFHNAKMREKLLYPFKIIYSLEARRKIRVVLDDFKPDVVHLNNFNYQLTPSIIVEIVKWREKANRKCKILYTAHDYQLICPNHMLFNPSNGLICEKCLTGNFKNCFKEKCIHNSRIRSLLGYFEAKYWNKKGIYKYIDKVVCCSRFMQSMIEVNPIFIGKTIAIHNFVDELDWKVTPKKDYVLYFGRYSNEKGIKTLLKVCEDLPYIKFVFAGSGPLNECISTVPNISNVGFKTSVELETLIREAKFSIYPSEWYENCPFSVMESQMYGTPVIGANIGGIPELIEDGVTGELFNVGDEEMLKNKIQKLWNDEKLLNKYTQNCSLINFDNAKQYVSKIIDLCSCS